MTFITQRGTYSPITLNGQRISQAYEAKYLTNTSGSQVNLEKTYIYQVQTTRIITRKNVLAIRQKITTVV